MRIVVAVGGNALIKAGQAGTWPEQLENVREIVEAVLALRAQGHEVVLTHGNGPHVGALLLQNALGEQEAAPLPLDALIAMTQGQIGYLLQDALACVDPDLPTATVLTRARVAGDDPAFASAPTKPIGPFYDEDEARRLADARGWDVGPDAGRGWRRMVMSPRPVEVLEHEQIELLAGNGAVVIAAGGGGIPVTRSEDGYRGLDAVIDKDRCSTELALQVGADLLVLTTSVARVSFDYGTRWQRDMARLTISDAVRHLRDGDFPPGSMGPKIEAAVRFASGSGRAAITDPANLLGVLEGDAGTLVVADEDGPSAVVPAPAAA